MFCPAVFREERPEVLRATIRAYPLATLVTSGAAGLVANLVPFTLVTRVGEPDLLRAHLAKANDQLAELRGGADALVIFQGPQAYISPGWYPTKAEHGREVPTWNYVVVQAWGRPHVIDDAVWLRAQIDALTAQQEAAMPAPWSTADAPARYIDALIGGIAGVEMAVDRIAGKWKASQNHPATNRLGVVEGLRASAQQAMADVVERAD